MMPPEPSTPRALGYRMPAEWAPHARSWMAWPTRRAIWLDGMAAAQAAYARVAQAIAEFEPVAMVCNPEDAAAARGACGSGVAIVEAPIDDSWMRDSGPSFVADASGGVAGVAWNFNSWGEKYRPYDRDAALAGRLVERLGLPLFRAPITLEGGAITVDGAGAVIATEQCVLGADRNPTRRHAEIEQVLADYLGVETVIWLAQGFEDDDTGGHIDLIAAFVAPGRVLALSTDDTNDPNYITLSANLARLQRAHDAAGRRLEVIALPQPARETRDGARVALTPMNFYVVNGGVILPTYGVPEDDRAAGILAELFPGRRVVGIAARAIVAGGGSIHCITQQEPAAGA